MIGVTICVFIICCTILVYKRLDDKSKSSEVYKTLEEVKYKLRAFDYSMTTISEMKFTLKMLVDILKEDETENKQD